MEINPFHNGHVHFIKEARKIAKNDLLICIISTNFVQRGELSMLNKKDKTNLLLSHGVDIVCELPMVLANQGGSHFAFHSIRILANYGVTNLIFGSESADIEFLKSSSLINCEVNDFKLGIHNNLNELKSNDILGISYINAINELNLNWNIHLVKRISNEYNQINIKGEIASATSIRNNITNTELISSTLPPGVIDSLLRIDENMLFQLFKVNLANCIDNNINIFLSEYNQLLLKIQKVLNNDSNSSIQTLNDLTLACADRNNSKYKISRICLNVILLIEYDDYNGNYYRTLGFNTRASRYLPNNSFTSLVQNDSNIAQIEARASKLFSILTKDFQYNEYDRKPIIFNNQK